MKNRMLRGNPAPTGYAASISEVLRAYVYRHRAAGVTINQRARLDLLDSCASLPVGVGDDDPRIRTLALGNGNRWEPGANQRAVLDTAGEVIPGEDAPTLKPDDLLAALVHAGALDRELVHEQEIAHVKKGEEAAPTHEAMLQFERDRADTEAAARKELQRENQNLRDEVMSEKARRRRAEAVAMGDEPTATKEPPATESTHLDKKRDRLPAGVRLRGSSYQAYWRNERGRQQQKDGFSTAQEASEHRRRAMEQVAMNKTASDAQHPREFNPSPEELAAMQEKAAA